MRKVTFILIPIFMLFTKLATADALPINPGLWEFTSTSTNPFTGQQESETETECIVDDEYDPATMMQDENDCEMGESNLNGDTLTFSMSCNMEMGQMTMNGVYQSNGESAQGTTNVEMSFGGQTMSFQGSWTGQRIGGC